MLDYQTESKRKDKVNLDLQQMKIILITTP